MRLPNHSYFVNQFGLNPDDLEKIMLISYPNNQFKLKEINDCNSYIWNFDGETAILKVLDHSLRITNFEKVNSRKYFCNSASKTL